MLSANRGNYSVGMQKQQRPLAFWAVIAAIVFAAMLALWGFGDEPTGVVLVLAGILFWGSGLALVLLGLIAISRWRREPVRGGPDSAAAGRD